MKALLFFRLSVIYWVVQILLLLLGLSNGSGRFIAIGGSVFLVLCCPMLLVKNKTAKLIASICLIAYSAFFLLSACVVLPFVWVPFILYVLAGIVIVANFIMALFAFRFSRVAIL
ncbi:MAG: hypothetical protein LBG19_02750 [Prevotellaceae bacterium]|jgi:hypothetical protein|nr:hypothetical protein [Prevotellaceae bacterium]